MAEEQGVQEYRRHLLEIHGGLDKLTESLMTGKVRDETADSYFSYVSNALFPLRLKLGTIYHKIPYEEARVCQGRIEVIDKAVQDLLERKRLEELMRWSDRIKGMV